MASDTGFIDIPLKSEDGYIHTVEEIPVMHIPSCPYNFWHRFSPKKQKRETSKSNTSNTMTRSTCSNTTILTLNSSNHRNWSAQSKKRPLWAQNCRWVKENLQAYKPDFSKLDRINGEHGSWQEKFHIKLRSMHPKHGKMNQKANKNWSLEQNWCTNWTRTQTASQEITRQTWKNKGDSTRKTKDTFWKGRNV